MTFKMQSLFQRLIRCGGREKHCVMQYISLRKWADAVTINIRVAVLKRQWASE